MQILEEEVRGKVGPAGIVDNANGGDTANISVAPGAAQTRKHVQRRLARRGPE
jgi:hypothetical protein